MSEERGRTRSLSGGDVDKGSTENVFVEKFEFCMSVVSFCDYSFMDCGCRFVMTLITFT